MQLCIIDQWCFHIKQQCSLKVYCIWKDTKLKCAWFKQHLLDSKNLVLESSNASWDGKNHVPEFKMTQCKYSFTTSVIWKQMWNCCINIKMWMLLLALNFLLMIFWKLDKFSPPQLPLRNSRCCFQVLPHWENSNYLSFLSWSFQWI